jgi:hypothetical protein
MSSLRYIHPNNGFIAQLKNDELRTNIEYKRKIAGGLSSREE